MWAHLPGRVSIYEVSLRDGLQNESRLVSTESKRELAEALIRTGLERIELTSFVSDDSGTDKVLEAEFDGTQWNFLRFDSYANA